MSDLTNIFAGINAETAEAASKPSYDNSPIPPGEYHLSVVGAELKESKSGNPYVSVQYRIEDGQPHANRRIFEIYMLGGSDRAVEISNKQLSILLVANGLESLSDPSQLVNAHVWAGVKIEEGRDGYADKNRVNWVNRYEGQDNDRPAADAAGEFDAF